MASRICVAIDQFSPDASKIKNNRSFSNSSERNSLYAREIE